MSPIEAEPFCLNKACLSYWQTGNNTLRNHSPVVVHEAIMTGLPGVFLKELAQDVPGKILCSALGVSPQRFSQIAKRRHLSKSHTEAMIGFIAVWHQVLDVLGADYATEWLNTALPVLDGLRPCDLLDTNYGRSLLSQTLDEMRYGEFT
ncbi:MAG: antitoxin Xre/MbcA/ParS toxin-binding domain-containing protein [Pseudomonadota bacterium]